MKEIYKNLVIFAALLIAFSALTSCTGTQTEPQEPGNQPQTSSGQTANTETKSKSSDYPLVSQAIAQSEIRNLDNTTFKVEDKKGKVVLLNLWATWCGPCRSEMPTLVELQDKFRDKDFEIIGIDTDDEPVSKINSFRNEMKLNYTLVWSDGDLQNELVKVSKFPGIPQSFLIDREGRLRGVFKGANPGDVKKLAEIVESVVNE
jgi:thiol-disulfide isomerase/thioredoxin